MLVTSISSISNNVLKAFSSSGFLNELEKSTPIAETTSRARVTITSTNQSVENAGVAFVKGVDERNKFFEEINNQ